MRRRALTRAVLHGSGVVGALAAGTGVASAHLVTGRLRAPMPLGFVFVGGALAVAATAAVLAASDVTPGHRSRSVGRLPAGVVRSGEAALRGSFLGLFALVLGAGIVGPPNPLENVATVVVWAVWLTGLAIVAALLGNPWRVLSPWRTVYEALVRLEGEEIAVLGSYPRRLGEWPALLGYVLWLGIAATVTGLPRSPRGTAVLLATYAGVMLLGGIAYGRAWFEHADALGVLYRLFGRVSPVELDRVAEGARLSLRYPWMGCTKPVEGTATAAFVVATVYTVTFDGFRSTPEYQSVSVALRDAVEVGDVVHLLLYVLGLALFLATFAVVVRLAARPARAADGAGLHAIAPTVLPIAIAYEIAHFYPYVVSETGRAVWLLLGGGGTAPDPLGFLSLTAFWGSQAILIVGGHVVAVVAAHAVTRRQYGERTTTMRAHLPVTVLMIGYTVLSLWIVSRPFVGG